MKFFSEHQHTEEDDDVLDDGKAVSEILFRVLR